MGPVGYKPIFRKAYHKKAKSRNLVLKNKKTVGKFLDKSLKRVEKYFLSWEDHKPSNPRPLFKSFFI